MHRTLCALVSFLLVVPALAEGPVATVGERTITQAELEKHVKSKLVEIDNQRYEALKEGLDEMVAEELFAQEAKARGVTPEALEKSEIEAKAAAPSDAEIQQVYDANKEQLGGQALDAVKPRIVEFLKGQKAAERHEAFIGELKGKYKTTVALKPPVIDVQAAGRPQRGGASAAVTIITFSDYECPYCKRAEKTVEQVEKAYGDKVRVVFRDFPLSFHARAQPAAEAANCANAQGKFWEYHEKLFAASPDLTDEKFKALAAEVGLDAGKFAQCLEKREFKAAVEKDMQDGASVGVTGTPAFFINGRMLSGAQPFEKFKEIIDEELARAGKS